MHAVTISIERFLDEHPPGFVECALTDTFGKKHLFVEKVPVVTLENISSDSTYPRLGLVACEIEAIWQDPDARPLVRINTARPWSVESVEGVSVFVVLKSQVRRYEAGALVSAER